MIYVHVNMKHDYFECIFSASTNNCRSEPREDQRLYWMAVSRLPPFDAEHEVQSCFLSFWADFQRNYALLSAVILCISGHNLWF